MCYFCPPFVDLRASKADHQKILLATLAQTLVEQPCTMKKLSKSPETSIFSPLFAACLKKKRSVSFLLKLIFSIIPSALYQNKAVPEHGTNTWTLTASTNLGKAPDPL